MPEFQVEFTHVLSLTGSLTIRARNVEAAEKKADKIAEMIGGIQQWDMAASGDAEEIEWQEDENTAKVESVTEI